MAHVYINYSKRLILVDSWLTLNMLKGYFDSAKWNGINKKYLNWKNVLEVWDHILFLFPWFLIFYFHEIKILKIYDILIYYLFCIFRFSNFFNLLEMGFLFSTVWLKMFFEIQTNTFSSPFSIFNENENRKQLNQTPPKPHNMLLSQPTDTGWCPLILPPKIKILDFQIIFLITAIFTKAVFFSCRWCN